MGKPNLKKLTLLTCLLPCFAHAELSIDDEWVDDGAGAGQAATLVRPAPERTRQAVPIPPRPQEQQSGLLIDGRAVRDDEPIVVRAEQPPPAPKAKPKPAPAPETDGLTEQEAASLPEVPIALDSVDEGENARIVKSMAHAEQMAGIIDFNNPKDMAKVQAMKQYEHQKHDPLWLASQDPAMVWTVGIIWVLVLLLVFAGFLYIMSRKKYAPLEQPQPYQPPPSRFNRMGQAAPPPAGGQAPIMRRANGRPQPNPQRLHRPPY